jgi:predicted dehydrogenase
MPLTPPTRRHFLKTAATAATLVAVDRSAHAAGSDIIRIGMVGCGGRCTGAAVDAMYADPGVRLVAMADLFPDRIQSKLDALRKERPDQVCVDPDHCFVGLDAYKRVIESADVVLIANAAKFHPTHLMAAIQAGKHAFVEKPHGIDPPGTRLITAAADLAKQKNLGVLSGLQSRFDPAIRETIQRVLDGQIGQVVSVEENFLREPYGTLYRDPKLSEIQYQYSNQYHFSWLSGDDVTQSLVHNLDRATWALGEQPPLKCHGLGGRASSLGVVYGNVFDHHSVVYEYACGARLYALCRTEVGCYKESSSILRGTKGVAIPLLGRIDGENPWKYEGPRPSPYRLEHQQYFASIRAGTPLNCGAYMARSTLVGIMGQLSCYSGKEITWDAVTRSDFYFEPRPEACTWDMQPPVTPDADGIYPVAVPGKTKTV